MKSALMELPPKLRVNPAVQSVAMQADRGRRALSAVRKQAAESRTMLTVTGGVAVVGGAALAGAVDGRMEPVRGYEPSLLGGIALTLGCVFTGIPELGFLASGMFAGPTYVNVRARVEAA